MLAVASLMGDPARAAAPAIQPGVYDELLIGYAPSTKVVTGYFSSETGAGRFNCIFYLTGVMTGAAAPITTYFPATPKDRISGVIKTDASGHVGVALREEHGGCWNVQHFADKDQPSDFTLSAAHPWIQIRVVRAKKPFFYNAPEEASRRRGYLVLGDGVGVDEGRPGWVRVDYPNTDKMTSGWIREADLFPGP